MPPKHAVICFIKRWFPLAALLAITLWFPSTREAQSLCLRWLLNLAGNTVVYGAYGYGASFDFVEFEIPNVQFTEKYTQELKAHSTNSLDDFARATGSGKLTYYRDLLRFPPFEAAWTNSPLLTWMTLRQAAWSVDECDTNPMPPAMLKSCLFLAHTAERADPGNGAFWQAEAALDFAARDNADALSALWTAASLTNWDAGSANAFAYLIRLYQQAGLSQLDAVAHAGSEIDQPEVPWQNSQFIQNQMVQAVRQEKPEQFSRLLQLLVELRRRDWADHHVRIANQYRVFPVGDDLVEPMAGPLKINLATNWSFNYEQSRVTVRQVFQTYLSKFGDPVTVAWFNGQTESYQTELRLRQQNNNSKIFYKWFAGCQITGSFAMLMLSLLCVSLLFEAVVWNLNKQTRVPGFWPRDRGFWILSLFVVVGSALVLARFVSAIDPGITFEELPDFVSPLAAAFLLLLAACFTWLWLLLCSWRKGRLLAKPWRTCWCLALAYLISVLAMAFCRSQLVAEICSQYQ